MNLLAVRYYGDAPTTSTNSDATGNIPGTVKHSSCPNEENDIGKVFMTKDSVFSSFSAAVDWHPSSVTAVSVGGSHAIQNFTVTFKR